MYTAIKGGWKMSKRMLVVFSFAFIVTLFFGKNHLVVLAETEEFADLPICETVDAQMESEIESVLEILSAKDFDQLTERINDLLATTELLEEEKGLMEVAGCLLDESEEKLLQIKVNGYHSLLVFAIQMKEEKDIQFEELSFEMSDTDLLLDVEGVLEEDEGTVYIVHDSSINPGRAILARDIRTMDKELKDWEENTPPPVVEITEAMASSSYAFLQNPIEKLMDSVDRYFTGKDEVERDYFVDGAWINASFFNMSFSIITFEESNWNTMNMVQYYPMWETYAMIDRAAQVHEEFPDYFYPKELIERGDWNGIVAYFKRYKSDMIARDSSLYYYIASDDLFDKESFEELVESKK